MKCEIWKDTRIHTRRDDRVYFCMKWNDGKKKDITIPWCFILEKRMKQDGYILDTLQYE